jgi:hypothetical protein
MLCLYYTLCLMRLSIVRNLILVEFLDWFTISRLLVIDAVGWRSMYLVVMPRVNLIVILSTYTRYLYSINCPNVICLPSMLLFILWRDTTSELWTPVQFPLYCYHLFTLLVYYYCFPLDTLIALFTANWWDWQLMWRCWWCKSPSSWEPQEEGLMSTAVSFPSVRNQGLIVSRKSQTQEGDAC